MLKVNRILMLDVHAIVESSRAALRVILVIRVTHQKHSTSSHIILVRDTGIEVIPSCQ